MCGINGIFAYHYAANPVDRQEMIRTREHMAARGPDGRGAWFSADNRVGFGHRRLSIIDLSEAGAQPMTSADGRFTVTFNGEIYNYRDLRRSLEEQGYVFRSQCDTEVLIHLYAEKGETMVHDLRGMFAFAIWDELARSLFLARDPYGIKPLYYADDGWTFRFASQVKALLAGGAISNDREPAGQVGFFLFGCLPEPFTLYREIRALPAGTTQKVGAIGPSQPRRYHSIAQVYCEAEERAKDFKTADGTDAKGLINAALLDSVRHHLMADVPVGAFLSGGIDSGVLVSLMRQAGQEDIQTVTLAFEEFHGLFEDEAPHAATVAGQYETRHTTRTVTQCEFDADLPYIFEAMDQPSIDGINSWYVSKAARELGLKVAISGLGGDELFGGYSSFRDIPNWVRLFKFSRAIPLGGRLSRLALKPLTSLLGMSPKAASMAEFGGSYAGSYLLKRGLFLPWELSELLDRDIVVAGMKRLSPFSIMGSALEPLPDSNFARVSALESSLYLRNQLLRDSDWASMAQGLEVRVPLVDATLLEQVSPITCGHRKNRGKALLAVAAIPPLPESILHRPKSGFMMPIAAWQRSAGLTRNPAQLPRRPSPWGRDWASTVMAA